MHPRPLLLVYVGYLVQAAVADQAAVRQRHVWFFTDNGRLDFHHLRYVIGAGFEFVRLHPFVYARQHVAVNVATIVNSTEVFDEVLEAHASLWFYVRRVQIGVKHYDCEC